jgi:hypothetical protein
MILSSFVRDWAADILVEKQAFCFVCFMCYDITGLSLPSALSFRFARFLS